MCKSQSPKMAKSAFAWSDPYSISGKYSHQFFPQNSQYLTIKKKSLTGSISAPDSPSRQHWQYFAALWQDSPEPPESQAVGCIVNAPRRCCIPILTASPYCLIFPCTPNYISIPFPYYFHMLPRSKHKCAFQSRAAESLLLFACCARRSCRSRSSVEVLVPVKVGSRGSLSQRQIATVRVGV